MQSWLLSKPIAHRGLHSNDHVIPENSIKAFAAAIANGYPIELDIHVLADGTVVVFHDDTLERMCGTKRAISTLTAGELNSFHLKNSEEAIPTLSTVLDFVAGRVPILIEIKKTKAIKNGNAYVKAILDAYPYEFAIQSFNPFILWWFAKNAGQYTRGQLSSAYRGDKLFFLAKILLSNYFFNFISRPDFIAHNVDDLPSKRVESLRKKGIAVLGWTIRSREKTEKVKPWCDNIIFEGFKPDP